MFRPYSNPPLSLYWRPGFQLPELTLIQIENHILVSSSSVPFGSLVENCPPQPNTTYIDHNFEEKVKRSTCYWIM